MTIMRFFDRSRLRARTRASSVGIAILLMVLVIGVNGCGLSTTPSGTQRTDASKPALVMPIPIGAHTEGGLRGAVIRVTTLAADGSGSLRSALERSEGRLVVFEVGGVIDLAGHSLVVKNPYLTLAGQTAPEPGITIIRGSLVVETHDVIIEHIAVRPGDRGPDPHTVWASDGLGTHFDKGSPVHDVLFEHCTATWAVDENLSASGPADVDTSQNADATSHNITIRSCLIAEGLSHATHPKGEHSKGTLIHDGVKNVEITGCLYAHNRERNPRLKGGTTSVVTGNVIYNWGNACVGVGTRGNRRVLQPAQTILVGNVAIAGRDTHSRVFVKSVDPGGQVFARDNIAVDPGGAPLPMMDDGVVTLHAIPSWSPQVPDTHALDNLARVLRSAGARPAHRDPVDARIVRSVIAGDGAIIDSQEQAGGYPIRQQTTRALIVPDDIEQRRRFLDQLSADLAEDTSLDLSPLLKRLRL